MASGKSTIGRLLAKKLNLKFFDTDFIIEKKTKMKIFEIFESFAIRYNLIESL